MKSTRCCATCLDEHQPEFAAHLQRDQIAGHEFLTLRLDGSMIPWDKIREDAEGDISEEQFNTIRDAISKQTLVVALGVVDEFVLLSVGDSTDHLEKMGQGSSLADSRRSSCSRSMPNRRSSRSRT